MAEAPDAQFVAEDAVFVYHKKFSVCNHDDHDDDYHNDYNDEEVEERNDAAYFMSDVDLDPMLLLFSNVAFFAGELVSRLWQRARQDHRLLSGNKCEAMED